MVRSSKLIFFHAVTLLLCLALQLSYSSWRGKKCSRHGGMPILLQRSQRLHSSWSQPRVQAGWQGTESALQQMFARTNPDPGILLTSTYTHFPSKTTSTVLYWRQKPTGIGLWPCPLPPGTHTLCLCLLGCLQAPQTVLGSTAACQQCSPLQRAPGKVSGKLEGKVWWRVRVNFCMKVVNHF